MANRGPTLREHLNDVARDHLAAVIFSFVVLMASAAGFYWSTQIDLIEKVGANTQRGQRNEALSAEIRGQLQSIQGDVSDIKTDVAVVKEKVTVLEGDNDS